MLKKSLLASIALISINPVLAAQHMQPPARVGSAQEGSNCPPCPCGGVQGWVLIPAGPGTPCQQGAGATIIPEVEVTPSPHHHHKAPMHPEGRTLEQQMLEDELHPVTPHIFLRANPNSPTPNKKEGEWGKELNGKVYFRHLGNWVYDPSVKASDIVSTDVKDKIKMFGGGKTPTVTNPPATVEAHKEAVVEAKKEAAAAATSAPKGSWTKDANGHWVRNTPPDALGTTDRPNTVDVNGRPIQGSFNKAQTGMTGGPAPRIDASANTSASSGQ